MDKPPSSPFTQGSNFLWEETDRKGNFFISGRSPPFPTFQRIWGINIPVRVLRFTTVKRSKLCCVGSIAIVLHYSHGLEDVRNLYSCETLLWSGCVSA
eukprot:2150584-Amphidinium_carterae.1